MPRESMCDSFNDHHQRNQEHNGVYYQRTGGGGRASNGASVGGSKSNEDRKTSIGNYRVGAERRWQPSEYSLTTTSDNTSGRVFHSRTPPPSPPPHHRNQHQQKYISNNNSNHSDNRSLRSRRSRSPLQVQHSRRDSPPQQHGHQYHQPPFDNVNNNYQSTQQETTQRKSDTNFSSSEWFRTEEIYYQSNEDEVLEYDDDHLPPVDRIRDLLQTDHKLRDKSDLIVAWVLRRYLTRQTTSGSSMKFHFPNHAEKGHYECQYCSRMFETFQPLRAHLTKGECQSWDVRDGRRKRNGSTQNAHHSNGSDTSRNGHSSGGGGDRLNPERNSRRQQRSRSPVPRLVNSNGRERSPIARQAHSNGREREPPTKSSKVRSKSKSRSRSPATRRPERDRARNDKPTSATSTRLRRADGAGVEMYYCDFCCERVFKDYEDLYAHKTLICEQRERYLYDKYFVCKYCTRPYLSMFELQSHFRSEHADWKLIHGNNNPPPRN